MNEWLIIVDSGGADTVKYYSFIGTEEDAKIKVRAMTLEWITEVNTRYKGIVFDKVSTGAGYVSIILYYARYVEISITPKDQIMPIHTDEKYLNKAKCLADRDSFSADEDKWKSGVPAFHFNNEENSDED